jgi:outer membrane biosynthesis protein TonB
MTTAELIVAHPADDAAARKQETRKVLWAFLGALFLHLAVGYLLAAWGGAFSSAAPAEDKPIELSFVDLSTPVPIAPKNSMFMENEETNQAEPKEKTFESNANSTGASEAAASGAAPMPAQDGKERPFLEMQSQPHSLQVDGAQPQPSAKPMETPQPSEAPTAAPTPREDQLAMLTKTPTPKPAATPAQPQAPKSTYRPEKQQTRIAGNISNRGRSSVNAVATPLGRYQKELYDAVGSRWYFYVGKDRDLISIGTARLVFSVDRSGRVANLKIVDNSSNETFANVCLQSVLEIKLPPIPEDVASTLPPQGLEEDMSFTIYSN